MPAKRAAQGIGMNPAYLLFDHDVCIDSLRRLAGE